LASEAAAPRIGEADPVVRAGGHVSKRILVLIVGVLSAASAAHAQSSLQVPLQFDFLNPGARRMTLGGAFTAVADDATAAYTNPAGLTLLSRPEVSFEGRGRHLESPFLFGGRLSGPVTNQGVDTVAGPAYRNSIDSGFGASFLSVVYPHGKWAVTGYRHELLRVIQAYQTQGVFQRILFSGVPSDIRELPQIGQREVHITSYAAAGAYKPNEKFAVGVDVSIYKFSLDSLFRRFLTPGFYSAPDYVTEFARASQTGDSTSTAVNVGVLFAPNSKLRLGASFKQGPGLGLVTVDSTTQPSAGTFKVPNAVAIGVMFRMTQAVTISADYDRIQYSSLLDNFVVSQVPSSGRPQNFIIDNSNEIHGGVEYVFTQRKYTPAVRAGAWYDPAHGVKYVASPANDSFDERFLAALPGGDSVAHVSVGGGLSLSRRFEINAAGDFTSKRRLVSASAVARF
jgi:long-subunit fatty acid transport protein